MARRRFHRVAPDRGWVVGHGGPTTLSANGGDNTTYFFDLFDFADIDPEALTGRIEQDKSDWFVKRVILNIAWAAFIDGLGARDHTRFAEWAVGTMSTANATELQANSHELIGPEAYNLWSRLFQTGVRPVYMPGVIPYSNHNPINELAISVNPLTNNAADNDEAGWLAAFPWAGESFVREDFSVSNAGLRNNQSCGLALTLCRGPQGFDWDESDTMSVTWWYQVLVQKRRA